MSDIENNWDFIQKDENNNYIELYFAYIIELKLLNIR